MVSFPQLSLQFVTPDFHPEFFHQMSDKMDDNEAKAMSSDIDDENLN